MRNLITFDTGDMSYHLEIPYAYPNVITGGSRGRVLEIAKYLANAEVFENKDRGKAVVNGFYFGMPVTAFSTGEGTGGVSCTWPEVIEAIEDDDINFIRIGTSGGIDPHLRVGDLVVTTKVEKKDATSDAVIAFLLEMNELWHAGELGDYPGAAKVYQRLNELYGSPKDFEDRIFSRNYGGYINPRTRSFLPMVPREIYETIEQSAIDTKIEGQKVYKGFTQVTPEIYLNNILESIRPTKGSIAVSM